MTTVQEKAPHSETVEVLQRRVAELERLLVEAQRLATVGSLSSRIAHELNNLLTPIISYSTHAIKLEDPALKEKALRKSADCGQRAADLVSGLLGFAARRHSAHEVMRGADLLDSAAALIEWDLKKDAINVVKKYQTDTEVDVVPADVQQVFLNIILNARQAMRPDGGTLTLEVRDDAESVLFFFADTGCGIEQEHMDKIFDPFFSTNVDGQGTGLGLPVAQDIIDEADGSIEVTSKVGEGTTFTVTLPAASRGR